MRSFIGKKFYGLLGVASISMIVLIGMQFVDAAIIGNFLGEDALAAINLVGPISSASAFAGNLIAIGTGILFTSAVGRFDKEEMARTVGQGIISSIGMGILILVVTVFGKNAYFDFYAVSDNVRKLADEYYFFYVPVFACVPIYNTIYELVFDEGDETICAISSATQVVGNIVSSIILCPIMGMRGVGLGMLIGVATSFVVLCLHFFKKTNTLKFKWHFSMKEFFNSSKYGAIDAMFYLAFAIMGIVIGKFIVANYGDRYLPVFTVVQNILMFELAFDGVGLAMRPLVNVFIGEKNLLGEKKILSVSTMVAIAEGIIASVVLICLATNVPQWLGITDLELINKSAVAIRYISITFAFSSLAFLLSSYYLLIDKIGLGLLVVAMKDLVGPILFGLLIASTMGKMEGVWIGFALAPAFAVVVVLVYVFVRYDRYGFPYLLEKTTKKIYSFEQNVVEEEITGVVARVKELAEKENIEPKISMHLQLLTEECLMLVKEKNAGKKIASECTLMIDSDAVTYIIRDNGIVFDMTDADNKISSLRSMVLSSLMEHYSDKANLVTTSYNRNIFKFANTSSQ